MEIPVRQEAPWEREIALSSTTGLTASEHGGLNSSVCNDNRTPTQESDHTASTSLVLSGGTSWLINTDSRPVVHVSTSISYLHEITSGIDGRPPGTVPVNTITSSTISHLNQRNELMTIVDTASPDDPKSNSRSADEHLSPFVVTEDSPPQYHSLSPRTPQRSQGSSSNHAVSSNLPLINPTSAQDYTITASSEQILPTSTLTSRTQLGNTQHTQSGNTQPRAAQSITHRSLSSQSTGPDRQPVAVAAECLHAHDYSKMIQLLSSAPQTVAVIFGLGLAYIKLKEYSKSRTLFTKMKEMTRQDLEQSNNTYLALYYLGEIEVPHKRYVEAASYFQQAVADHARNSVAETRYRINPPSKAILYSKQGSALRQAQKILAAVKAYKLAISVAETSSDKLAAHTSLGNLYQGVGENASALEQYEMSITLAEKIRDYISLGWAHGNMGNAYLGLYQKDKALSHLERSLDLTIEHEPDPKAIGRAYNNLGTAYQSMNDLTKAEEFYDLALSQAIYGSDVAGQARVYGNFGNLLMLQKKFESAIVHYSEALSLGTDRSTRSTAFHNRGCARYEKAESDKKQFLDPKPDVVKFEVTFSGPNTGHLPQFPSLPNTITKHYEGGRDDLIEVVKYHEETHHNIKGSSHGLSLSISLSESNSRTFHRLQDCLYNLKQNDMALEYAEQSRARSLGELLLQRKGTQLTNQLTSPLTIDQIRGIIRSNNTDIIFISYTGARLLVWVHTPLNGDIVTNMFQVGLEDDQFEKKSLDYFLRYTLNERLIEEEVEMYSYCSYESSPQLSLLNDLFTVPLVKILEAVHGPDDVIHDVVLVPDSYTNLMPVVGLLNTSTQQFLGDKLRFRYMPSFLTMGVLSQFPEVVVEVSEESQRFCVVGNPKIPQFTYQGETWTLGKLPYAAKEAEWVAHILRSAPTLREQATKMVVLSMINSAKVIHLATHGSASSGFLAFAGMASSRSNEVASDKLVLLYPEEVEKLSISPALVVLSSCDSGRGTVKADGIQGMARAFILAGAQSVLTTLWRVPDESACTFMMFFYQYLMDGCRGSAALHKAILSVRSFIKYSRYIHWSGYQLTGRDIQFRVELNEVDKLIRKKIGGEALFPRLDVVKALEAAFINDPNLPTDVQLIHGQHGMKPSEPVLNFIAKYHSHFVGGIYLVNGSCDDFIQAAETNIKKATEVSPQGADLRPTLIVLDNITTLPQSEFFRKLLKNRQTHIIVTISSVGPPSHLTKEIDSQLVRGTQITLLKPLTDLHSHQRIVHSLMKDYDFIPGNREQEMFVKIVEKSGGFPCVVDITSSLLRRCVEHCEETDTDEDFLDEFSNRVLDVVESDEEETDLESTEPSSPLTPYMSHLLEAIHLPLSDSFLLSSLSVFGGPTPIPRSIIELIQTIVMSAKSDMDSLSGSSQFSNLLSSKLLRVYPATVIATPTDSTPSSQKHHSLTEYEFYYVPQLVCDAINENMSEMDRLVAVTTAYTALDHYLQMHRTDAHKLPSAEHYCVAGLAQLLLHNSKDIDNQCYREIYRIQLAFMSVSSDDIEEQLLG